MYAKSCQLRYAWLEILFKSEKQNILLRLDSFEKPYKQLELVLHRDIQTLETMDNGFSIIFWCLDISVKHELELFIYCF